MEEILVCTLVEVILETKSDGNYDEILFIDGCKFSVQKWKY